MKTMLLTLVLFASSSCCWRCNNMGFPKKVTFQKEGGSVVLIGEDKFIALSITDYDGNGPDETIYGEDDVTIKYCWLTGTYRRTGDSIILLAAPSLLVKERVLYVHIDFPPGRVAEIKVYQ